MCDPSRTGDVTYEAARLWAERWARSWFLDSRGADRLRVAGIDAGWATHVDASETLARLAAQLAQGGASRPKLSPLAHLKALGYDRALRAMAGAAVGKPSHATRGRSAVLVEIPTPSMTDSIALVARQLAADGVNVWAADPRVRPRLSHLGLRPVSVAVPFRRQASLVLDGHREARAAWEQILADPPQILHEDRDVTQCVLAALRPLVERSVPWIAAEAEALRGLLGRVEPPAIVVASDQHRMGRIVTQLAPGRVVVVQHGLPQAEVGYLPVVAKKVAVWSEASHDWFVEHGTPAHYLQVTGNPRFDSLVMQTTAPLERGRARLPRGDLRVLLGLSPTDPARNRALLGMVLHGVAGMPSASLVVKLHPGQGDWSWVRGEIRLADVPGPVQILRQEPMSRLLRWAHATIVHRSTVALDSLVAGTPVVVGAVDESPNAATADLESLRLPIARDRHELRAALLELQDKTGRARYFSERASDIERVAGPTDGRAAERVAAMAVL